MNRPGGEDTQPAGASSWDEPRTGWIECAICITTISLDQYRSARCWTDPHGTTVAAHRACLIRVGETELQLPPDPGENQAASTGAADP